MALTKLEALCERLPDSVQGVIGHCTIYQALSIYYADCAKEGKITVYEEARLRALARKRLENYIGGKLLQFAAAGVSHAMEKPPW
jgi:hypothetical protein